MFALVITAFVVCFGTFWWGTARYFIKADGVVPKGMRGISRLSELFTLVQIVSYAFATPTRFVGLALLLYAGSLTLYASALGVHWRRRPTLAFSLDVPQHLVQKGPYRLVRHPVYTAYNLAWLAALPATGQAWHLAICVVMAIVYDRSARLEEAKFSQSALASEYANYSARTGRYLPNLLKLLRTRAPRSAQGATS